MTVLKRGYFDLILEKKISAVGIIRLWKGFPRKAVEALLLEVFEIQQSKGQNDF